MISHLRKNKSEKSCTDSECSREKELEVVQGEPILFDLIHRLRAMTKKSVNINDHDNGRMKFIDCPALSSGPEEEPLRSPPAPMDIRRAV